MMAVDVTRIPIGELQSDRADTMTDIENCQWAIRQGIKTYDNGKSIQVRLADNLQILSVINAELARRRSEGS